MGAELAVRRGVGTVVIDARRDAGMPDYTMASIVASDQLIKSSPEIATAAVRAIVKAQQALKADVTLAGQIGREVFPQLEAGVITDIVRRDLPYYDATITPEAVTRMIGFSQAAGILKRRPAYDEVVATQFRPLWTA